MSATSPPPKTSGRPPRPGSRPPQNALTSTPNHSAPTVALVSHITGNGTAYSLEDLPARIAGRIKVHPVTGCWIWDGPTDRDGYGKLGGRNTHRIIWELLRGTVPPKLVLDHREDLGCVLNHGRPDKACGFPGHLLPVTNRVNCTRAGVSGVAAINLRKDRCGRCGADLDLLNTYYKPGGGRDCRRCIRRRVGEYRQRHPEAVRDTRRRRRQRQRLEAAAGLRRAA